MLRYRLVGGALLIVAAAVLFLATDMTVPVPIALAIAGIALVGTSARRMRSL